VIHAKTAASYINHFDWLNYTDLTDKYLRFDIDIIGEDINYYPPVIKYFKAETYPYISGSYVEILDNGGDKIKIYSSASGHTYIPEFDETPSIYLTHTSGIKISKNLVDIEFSPKEDNINVGTMTDLLVWLDSRFPKGRELLPYSDSSSGVWFNSKSSSYSGSASAAALYPEYRVQSANMLKLNYSNGGEDGTTTGITASAASVSVSPDGVVSGNKSFKITPNGTSNNSYIYFDSNTGASFVGGLFSNGTYTAVATITLNKIQESSSLNSNARRLVIIPYISTASQTAIVSNQAPNEIGSHSLSVTFSLSSSITGATIRLMNGSASANDIVFYDNIGIYSGSSASLEWELPLSTYDDRPVFKFDGASELLSSSISLSQPMTIYAIVRGFDDNNAFIGRSASAPSLYSSAGYYRMYAGTELVSASPITSSFTTLVGVFNGATSSLYVNNSIVSGDVGSGSITNYIDIGHRFNQDGIEQYLKGDVAGILIFNTAHSASIVQNIREWIVDAFNM